MSYKKPNQIQKQKKQIKTITDNTKGESAKVNMNCIKALSAFIQPQATETS